MVVDARTVAAGAQGAAEPGLDPGGRAGPTFNEAGGRGGRTNGAKRSILVDRIGLPIAVRVDSAKPHDVALRNVNPTTRSR
jgi:hypothetical protein